MVYDRAGSAASSYRKPLGEAKEWRALATCYDKTAASYLGGLHLTAALDWLPNELWAITSS